MKNIIRLLPVFILLLPFQFLSCNLSGSGNDGDSYILVYGVADYSIQSLPNLNYTDDDAIAIAELFNTKGYNVRLRINNGIDDGTEAATLDQLQQDIDDLSEIIDENDTFVFYYSGHGGRHYDYYGEYSEASGNEDILSDTDDEWIFLYAESALPEYANWKDRTVNDDILNTMLKELQTFKKVVILDSCNSGGFIGYSEDFDAIIPNYSPVAQEEADSDFLRIFSLSFTANQNESSDISASNAIVLSAAGEQEYSWENGGYQHGIFTFFLLESAEMGDNNNDGYISVLESYYYTVQKIEKEWNYSFFNINSTYYSYHPRISGGPVDFLLFK